MKANRFTPAQILAALRDGSDGMPVSQIMRVHGVSRPMYLSWMARYAGADERAIARLRVLEMENARLRKLHVASAIRNGTLRDMVALPGLPIVGDGV